MCRGVPWSPRVFALLRLSEKYLRPVSQERRARLPKALSFSHFLSVSETLRVTTSIFPHACALGLEVIVSKRRVYLRVADFSKLLAVEDKTPVLPRSTYSLPA